MVGAAIVTWTFFFSRRVCYYVIRHMDLDLQAAHKKARRQYLRTTRNRGEGVESEWTPFRTAEKRFKARFPPPDLLDVLDLTPSEEGGLSGRLDAVECRQLPPRSDGKSDGKVFVVPSIPGA
jgi:alkylated DNA repair protein alkB homolog 1